MRRCSSIISSPLAAVALLLLLICFYHCAAAARLLPALPNPLVHQENAVKADAIYDPAVVLRNGAAVNGNDLSASLSSEKMLGADEEEPPACDEGSDDECMQRRLLSDAHLDYIYTQHKGNKP